MGFESLEGFLGWVATSGAAGVGLAHILDNLGWFANLSGKQKFYYVLTMSLVAPVLGVLGLAWYTGTPTTLDLLFMGLQAGIFVFGGSQWAHTHKSVSENVLVMRAAEPREPHEVVPVSTLAMRSAENIGEAEKQDRRRGGKKEENKRFF